jgi:hypothetical protein
MQLLNGAAGAALSLALFLAAFLRSSPALATAAALASVPFCAFTSGYPLFGGMAWVALAGNGIAAATLGFRKDVAFAALTPFLGICLFLCVLGMRGIRLWHP